MDRYLPAGYSKVIISGKGKKDPALLWSFALSTDKEKEIRKRFRKPDELPKLLIVTQKLLTGFDAPILYCMYLDKPMRDHVLLQAIARVNRPYEDQEGRRKPCGFVLDFVGIFDRLEKALAFDSKDVEGVVAGMDVLKARFAQLMEQARREYLPTAAGTAGDRVVEAILEHFRDQERREEFYAFFREVEELHEIISPDAFMRPFLDDYQSLADMVRIVRSNYDRGIILDKRFLRKTARLVQEYTETPAIRDPGAVYEITSGSLEAIANRDQPDTVKVFNLLKAIEQLIADAAAREPYLISIGDKAEQIAQAFEERQKTTQETLEELRRLIQEISTARQQRDSTQLSPEAFAVYWLLKQQKISQAGAVAQAAGQAFDDYAHWHSSSHQEQEVRKALYKALIDAGVDGVVDVAKNLLRMLRRAAE